MLQLFTYKLDFSLDIDDVLDDIETEIFEGDSEAFKRSKEKNYAPLRYCNLDGFIDDAFNLPHINGYQMDKVEIGDTVIIAVACISHE